MARQFLDPVGIDLVPCCCGSNDITIEIIGGRFYFTFCKKCGLESGVTQHKNNIGMMWSEEVTIRNEYGNVK